MTSYLRVIRGSCVKACFTCVTKELQAEPEPSIKLPEFLYNNPNQSPSLNPNPDPNPIP